MTLTQTVLFKLDWPLVLDILAGGAQSDEGRERCLGLSPTLDREAVEHRWRLVEPLKNIIHLGYKPPIGSIPPISAIIKSVSLGQILNGEDFRHILQILEATKGVSRFAYEFSTKAPTLSRFKSALYPLPKLSQAIEKTIGPTGDLLDDASAELQRIRRQKINMRKKIEDELTKLIRSSDIETYLQDDFFTVRSEHYVIPISLDGRGRIKGMILDTSASGQTLFVEPTAIAPLNEELLDIYLNEKIEILRIFKDLTNLVQAEIEILKTNYNELIELDFLTAQAELAYSFGANQVKIKHEPVINLQNIRHPLIKRPDGTKAIPNTVQLDSNHRGLVISGPNAGGKTVVLKTVGLLHVMAKAGLLIPAEPESEIFLFDGIFMELGDAQNITTNMSTFSGHLMGLKPILEKAAKNDLVLLDELAVGTDPETGAAIARATLEHLINRECMSLTTTHFDALKVLPTEDKRFRNASMEFSLKTLRPTYKLILDRPGQSYGIEVAEEIGLPKDILTRAKELRGSTVSLLDKAVNEFAVAKEEVEEMKVLLEKQKLEAEAAMLRWEDERRLMTESRQKVATKIKDKYESEFLKLRSDFDEIVAKLKDGYKKLEQSGDNKQGFMADKKRGEELLGALNKAISGIETVPNPNMASSIPVTDIADLKEGTEVFVVPLNKMGRVAKGGASGDQMVEVVVGAVKMKAASSDLRIKPPANDRNERKSLPIPPKKPSLSKPAVSPSAAAVKSLFIRSATNTLDLRGLDSHDALKETWQFIDNAIFRGEPNVMLIHGHGTDKLKTAIRLALQHESPYSLSFRGGDDTEGGDGVTIVILRD